MSETADIIIIGGGVMGASIAYHLAKQGDGQVMLLERQALCNGTTGHSGAIVRHITRVTSPFVWQEIVLQFSNISTNALEEIVVLSLLA